MEKILQMLADEQDEQIRTGAETDMTVEFAHRARVTGIIESTADGVISIRRLMPDGESYADTPRHYSIADVIGAYYTEGS